ncbi:MAG: hypothetical protein ACYTHK_11995 [Planctomycetota bacterium]|jgi:hypothetical protein
MPRLVPLLFLAACYAPAVEPEGFDPWVGTYRRDGITVRIEMTSDRHYRYTDPPYRGFVFIEKAGWLEDRGLEVGRIVPSYEDSQREQPHRYQALRCQFQDKQFTLIRQ